jgi:hypothetical protein
MIASFIIPDRATINSHSPSIRFVIANSSPQQICRTGSPSPLGRISDRNGLSSPSGAFSSLLFSDERSHNVGNSCLFLRRFRQTSLHGRLCGERGRNRTYNLLFNCPRPEINGFSDFPTVGVGNLKQEWAAMVPNLIPSGGYSGSQFQRWLRAPMATKTSLSGSQKIKPHRGCLDNGDGRWVVFVQCPQTQPHTESGSAAEPAATSPQSKPENTGNDTPSIIKSEEPT